MNKYYILFFFCVGIITAQEKSAKNTQAKIVKSDTTKSIKIQNTFAVGEKLIFDVGYGFITAGEATMEVPQYDSINGNLTYKILFTVRTTPTFSAIFEVRDRYETFMDVKTLLPWRFEQHIREGKYKRDFSATFDRKKNLAFTSSNDTVSIPPDAHDIVSAFYFIRTMDFSKSKKGDVVYLKNFYKDTTYQLQVKYHGKQTISVDAGTFNCFIVEPMVKEGGLFKSEGKILIWLSDDERKIPVKVSTKVIIGSIDAELREYYGINGELKGRKK